MIWVWFWKLIRVYHTNDLHPFKSQIIIVVYVHHLNIRRSAQLTVMLFLHIVVFFIIIVSGSTFYLLLTMIILFLCFFAFFFTFFLLKCFRSCWHGMLLYIFFYLFMVIFFVFQLQGCCLSIERVSWIWIQKQLRQENFEYVGQVIHWTPGLIDNIKAYWSRPSGDQKLLDQLKNWDLMLLTLHQYLDGISYSGNQLMAI